MDGKQALQILREELKRRPQAEIAKELDVEGSTVSRWKSAKSPPTKGLGKLTSWADRVLSKRETQPRTAVVKESGPSYDVPETRAQLHGRSVEVQALIAFALERQRLLTTALGGEDLALLARLEDVNRRHQEQLRAPADPQRQTGT